MYKYYLFMIDGSIKASGNPVDNIKFKTKLGSDIIDVEMDYKNDLLKTSNRGCYTCLRKLIELNVINEGTGANINKDISVINFAVTTDSLSTGL